MTTAIAKMLQRCLRPGNFQRGKLLVKRLDSSTANIPCLAVSQSTSGWLMGNNFGRSIWCLAPLSHRTYKSTKSGLSVSCTCGSFHSESDKAFSHLLLEEIAGEKERMIDIPHPEGGWNLKRNGADCKLHKMIESDRIEVSFNVNGSVPPASGETEADEEIIAQPDFMVEIKKGSSPESLLFECYFPDPEQSEDEEQHENIFSIRSVILSKGEVSDSTYVVDTENVDPNVYDHMLTYLEERGIHNNFANELVNIATGVENQQYVDTLEKLQKFVSCH